MFRCVEEVDRSTVLPQSRILLARPDLRIARTSYSKPSRMRGAKTGPNTTKCGCDSATDILGTPPQTKLDPNPSLDSSGGTLARRVPCRRIGSYASRRRLSNGRCTRIPWALRVLLPIQFRFSKVLREGSQSSMARTLLYISERPGMFGNTKLLPPCFRRPPLQVRSSSSRDPESNGGLNRRGDLEVDFGSDSELDREGGEQQIWTEIVG